MKYYMKHIKLFESFGENQPWVRVSMSEHSSRKSAENRGLGEPFTPEEIDRIKMVVRESDNSRMAMAMAEGRISDIIITDTKNSTADYPRKKMTLRPTKLADGSVYVSERHEQIQGGHWRKFAYPPSTGEKEELDVFYKCNDVDGFIDLLSTRFGYIHELRNVPSEGMGDSRSGVRRGHD